MKIKIFMSRVSFYAHPEMEKVIKKSRWCGAGHDGYAIEVSLDEGRLTKRAKRLVQELEGDLSDMMDDDLIPRLVQRTRRPSLEDIRQHFGYSDDLLDGIRFMHGDAEVESAQVFSERVLRFTPLFHTYIHGKLEEAINNLASRPGLYIRMGSEDRPFSADPYADVPIEKCADALAHLAG
ncbi:MAG: hypothetical protein D6751_10810 [Deltaproteobacteria bacterium]|nr:MAG: hypothetical protein D6751_10810 [Deltaproteobacteria bacterium]